ncbi:hypothetical protein K1T71_013902 [Dendrolimus kikuchii]|uniref:Uncharacterized protein n=1 Tax=Dendrolimus kikuchii TaxID=765133 RepID=A0ACC1CG32_9NEOP|nr:hypothetical protein K1T71_013902 [Dendrolimus kikuchii]
MFTFLHILFFIGSLLFYKANSIPQQPEINDQFETTETTTIKQIEENTISIDDIKIINNSLNLHEDVPNISITTKVCTAISEPFRRFVSTPKVSMVLRNIGTCIVNGAMDIISYFFPAPFIPLIASAAGLVIPFEPVVMLKERMPVTSYRRAFASAMHSFMSTFDRYKMDEDPDPYMTRRFNRRFMVSDPDKKEEDDIKI